MASCGCRTLILYSVERFFACFWPLKFGSGGFGFKKAVALELITLFLSMIYALENLVTSYYFLAHDDGQSPMGMIIGPVLVRWHRLQSQAEVRRPHSLPNEH